MTSCTSFFANLYIRQLLTLNYAGNYRTHYHLLRIIINYVHVSFWVRTLKYYDVGVLVYVLMSHSQYSCYHFISETGDMEKFKILDLFTNQCCLMGCRYRRGLHSVHFISVLVYDTLYTCILH